MPSVTRFIYVHSGVIAAVGEYVIAEEALAGGDEGVGIDEATELRVIITALEVIERCFLVLAIATGPKFRPYSTPKMPHPPPESNGSASCHR